MSFELSPNQDPVVALNEINVIAAPLSTSNASLTWPSDSFKLLDSGNTGLYTIDSSTPYLWLPESVCLQFEKALGLQYDEDIELYTFAEKTIQHELLLGWNMTFNFIIADLPGSTKAVSLNLPYAAFDLQLTYPFLGLNATQSSAPTNYFPLRKAVNSTQYTLGRAFLQETYLTVDYERNNFSISQADFDTNAINNKHLVDISRPRNSTFGGPKTDEAHRLSKSAITGIIVGAIVLGLGSISFAILCLMRRRSAYQTQKSASTNSSQKNDRSAKHMFWRRLFVVRDTDQLCEVDGCHRQPNEAPSEGEIKELPAQNYSELEGSKVEFAPHEATRRKLKLNIVNARGHDPKKPVEVDGHSISSEHFMPQIRCQVPRNIEVPPYSPSHVRTQYTPTTGISDNSRGSREWSQISSPAIVSPLTPGFPLRTGWMGHLNQSRNQSDGSDGEANSHDSRKGRESESEDDAQYPNHSPESHKFSWEEHR